MHITTPLMHRSSQLHQFLLLKVLFQIMTIFLLQITTKLFFRASMKNTTLTNLFAHLSHICLLLGLFFFCFCCCCFFSLSFLNKQETDWSATILAHRCSNELFACIRFPQNYYAISLMLTPSDLSQFSFHSSDRPK